MGKYSVDLLKPIHRRDCRSEWSSNEFPTGFSMGCHWMLRKCVLQGGINWIEKLFHHFELVCFFSLSRQHPTRLKPYICSILFCNLSVILAPREHYFPFYVRVYVCLLDFWWIIKRMNLNIHSLPSLHVAMFHLINTVKYLCYIKVSHIYFSPHLTHLSYHVCTNLSNENGIGEEKKLEICFFPLNFSICQLAYSNINGMNSEN